MNAKTPPPPEDFDDNPEWTDEIFQAARPLTAAEVQRRRGRPTAEVSKAQVTLRLDPDIVAHYRASGAGWQTRINALLRAGMTKDPTP